VQSAFLIAWLLAATLIWKPLEGFHAFPRFGDAGQSPASPSRPDGADLPAGSVLDGGVAEGPVIAGAGAGIDAGTGRDGGAPDAPPSAETARPQLVTFGGQVLARGTRQPLPGALVSLGAGTSVETGAGGRFSVQVPPGKHALRVQCPGYAPAARWVTLPVEEKDFVVRLEPRLTGERYETVVTGAPEEAPSVPLRKEELIHTAGSLGDPVRVIESLPGVVQSTWPLPFYAIRGANPGNTGFFVDGVRAPALFHFALGPSVLHPFFIEQLDFYPGGYPVDYGRYVSGIVSAQTASPATDRLHVSADVRLFDAGGIVATPFDQGKGTIAVAGRYSYTGYILSAFSNAYSLDYWDYQVRVEHTLGPGKLTLFAFGSGDTLEQKNPDATDWGFVGVDRSKLPVPGSAKLMFHRLQLRWAGDVARGRLTASVVGGMDDSTVSITSVFSLPVGSRSYTLAPRVSERWTLTSWLAVEVGADAEIQRFRPTSLVQLSDGFLKENYGRDLFHDRSALAGGAYLGLALHAGERLVISPGFRYEGYFEQGTQAFAPSPRLLVRYRVGARDWVKLTAGQFSQMPSLPVGVPGFESFGLANYGLQRSRQASLGYESALEDLLGFDLNLDTSVFYQRLHLGDLRNTLLPDPQAPDLIEPREGEAYGLEVMLRRPMKHRVYGWLAYTLSRSSRVVDGMIVPSDWDKTHVLNLVAGFRLPYNISSSARFHYNGGRPYPLYSRRDGRVYAYIRMPAFAQLDLRVDKRFTFDRFILDAYIELVNATMSQETYDVKQDSDGTMRVSAYRLVLPSLGVHAEF
jgi:hypothetical protein